MKLSSVVLVLVVVAIMATAATAAQTTFTKQIPTGWTLLALPGIPLDPDPPTIFGSVNIDGTLYKFDAVSQSLQCYDMFAPDLFGNMLLTDGYWINNIGSAASVSYQGLDDNDSMDIWISLPTAGWTLMGNPFSYNFTWGNAKVTDGNTTKTLEDAVRNAGWLQSIGFGFDETSQSLYDIGLWDDFPQSEVMEAWHGYWIQSNVSKIALIFEAAGS